MPHTIRDRRVGVVPRDPRLSLGGREAVLSISRLSALPRISGLTKGIFEKMLHRSALLLVNGVLQLCHITGPRSDIQLRQHLVRTLRFLRFGDAAVRIGKISESDRTGRTGLRTCRNDITVAQNRRSLCASIFALLIRCTQ